MTLKLKPRERLLAANAIGNVKLCLTADSYEEAFSLLGTAMKALDDLRVSMSGYLPEAVPTAGHAPGKDGSFGGKPQPVTEGFGANGSSKLSKEHQASA